FETVKPPYDFNYWEIVRPSTEKTGGDIRFRKGMICQSAENPIECSLDFYRTDDSLTETIEEVINNDMPFYIRTNQRNYNRFWLGSDELKKFIGVVDSKGDALLIAAAAGFFFETNDSYMSGIRQTRSGYEIIALKTISECKPLLINQYLLKVDQNGNMEAEAEKVFIDEAKTCE
ncbi:MAG: hypothetical protein WBA74_08090, partial [Cyclobacteriaceae bacterium]